MYKGEPLFRFFPARSSDTGTAGTGIEILGSFSARPLIVLLGQQPSAAMAHKDDWEVSIHYLPSPTQVETGLRLVNIDACFDANRSSSLDLKEICTKGGGIFTDVA